MSSDPRSSERQSPTVGTYVCSFCNHPSVSLAAIRDHLESSHKDKVFTDEDFISSVIYKPHSLSIKPSSNVVKTLISNLLFLLFVFPGKRLKILMHLSIIHLSSIEIHLLKAM